jgi:hypothetical protein
MTTSHPADDTAAALLEAATTIDTIAAELAGLHDHWQLTGAPPESISWLAGVLYRLGYLNARLNHTAGAPSA